MIFLSRPIVRRGKKLRQDFLQLQRNADVRHCESDQVGKYMIHAEAYLAMSRIIKKKTFLLPLQLAAKFFIAREKKSGLLLFATLWDSLQHITCNLQRRGGMAWTLRILLSDVFESLHKCYWTSMRSVLEKYWTSSFFVVVVVVFWPNKEKASNVKKFP